MWLHAAFTSELKTTFALNWAYNAVTRYGWNVFFASFEMTYEELLHQICCLHSANKKWLNAGRNPIDYQKFKAGSLSEEDVAFFKNEVLPDFENNREYGKFHVEQTTGNISIAELKIKMETYHQQHPIGVAFIDHLGIVDPSNKSNEYVIALNSVLRDCKLMALRFNKGEGLPIVSLFQFNRQGKARADLNEGRYELRALTYANEAEKSSDIITYTYLNDDMRAAGETLFGCLKHRGGPLFKDFRAKIIWGPNRIINLELEDLRQKAGNITADVLKHLG
jgi:replicative DNA helicase